MKTNTLTRPLLLIISILFLVITSSSKEGMWIPTLLKVVEGDMQSMGMEITAEDIYSINQSSLKDAIVHFGGGCTSELISDKGLLLTNHHCGYGQIQRHSSVENDILKNGFWAANMSEELTNPGLTATLIVRIEDVTEAMLKGITASLTPEERQNLLTENANAIKESALEGTNHEASIKPFNYGNDYYMIVTKVYKDVRLVGAPPSSVGKFGGDTDNWVWPRHTGDFSLFRIYAGPDNEPAEYSEENVPFKPAQHLKISMDGINEGDFTMVFGFPGRTEVYLTSYAVDYVMNKSNPMRLDMREKSLSIIDAARASSDELRIAYAAKQSRISNAYKKWIGQNQGLVQLRALEKKRSDEIAFGGKSLANLDMLKEFEAAYQELQPYSFSRDLLIEYFYYGPEIVRFAQRFDEIINNAESLEAEGELQGALDKALASAESYFGDYDLSTDKKIFEKLTELYIKYLPSEFLAEQHKLVDTKFKGNYKAYTEFMYEASVFKSMESLKKAFSGYSAKKAKKLKKDPVHILSSEIFNNYLELIRPKYAELSDKIDLMMKDYVVEWQKVFPDRVYWPDANSTMRLTYGKAEGSAPHDGMRYDFYSTSKGILQKYQPGHADFDLPERLVELLEEGDFGPYATDGELRVCFTGSNHTTGGNSGSPALNKYGYLVGLNFDRTWESTMSDILFAPERCRNIMVDIKYVLFIIDKYAGAKHLIDEMSLVSGPPEKPETDNPEVKREVDPN